MSWRSICTARCAGSPGGTPWGFARIAVILVPPLVSGCGDKVVCPPAQVVTVTETVTETDTVFSTVTDTVYSTLTDTVYVEPEAPAYDTDIAPLVGTWIHDPNWGDDFHSGIILYASGRATCVAFVDHPEGPEIYWDYRGTFTRNDLDIHFQWDYLYPEASDSTDVGRLSLDLSRFKLVGYEDHFVFHKAN